MIAPMDQLLIVGRRGSAHELLMALQSLGVVQVDPLEPIEGRGLARVELEGAEKASKEDWDAVASTAEALVEALRVSGVRPASRSELPAAPAEMNAYLRDLNAQVEELLAERGEIEGELEIIDTYLPLFRELAPGLAQLERSRYLFGTAFITDADTLEALRGSADDELEGRAVFAARPYGKGLLVIAAGLKSDREAFRALLAQRGLAELELPERYREYGFAKAVHVMEERSQALPKRRRTIENELGGVGKQHGGRLQAILAVALNHQARYEALQDMAEGRYSFVLRGWVPTKERVRVVEGLKKQFGDDVVIEWRQADEHHDASVPVQLDNPRWVKPFEGLLSLFAPPKYGSFDPSWTLAVFFPLYFGLVIGDIGFGLLFLALGLWLRARGKAGKELGLGPLGIALKPAALPVIGTVVNWCAAWAMFFGFLYGEFFGNLLEKWPAGRPVFYVPEHVAHGGVQGLVPILLFRVEQFTPLLLLSLGFGIVQVLGGWLIRIIYGARHHDRTHFWEGVGMFGGLAALIVFATAFLMGGLSTAVWVVVIAGFAVFFLGMALSRALLMIIELPSNGGNILSYLRLFAVGLSAALVANLVTDLGYAIGGVLPVVGPILGILLGLAVHLAALALTIIGHTLQPLRLQYVEFFTKFGFYDENGRPYKPFRLLGGKA